MMAMRLAGDWNTCAVGQCVFDLSEDKKTISPYRTPLSSRITCVSDAAGSIIHDIYFPIPETVDEDDYIESSVEAPYDDQYNQHTVEGLGIYFQDYIEGYQYEEAEEVRELIQTKIKQQKEAVLDCLED